VNAGCEEHPSLEGARIMHTGIGGNDCAVHDNPQIIRADRIEDVGARVRDSEERRETRRKELRIVREVVIGPEVLTGDRRTRMDGNP
jgi:hypothetical protein